MTSATRAIAVAHSSPGRLRLRLAWLREKPGRAEEIADRLAELAGVEEVRVRRSTGSVLCLYDPGVADEARIVDAVAAICNVRAARPGEREETARPQRPAARSVANALMQGFGEIDRDLRRITEGRIDLGTLAAFSFLGLGAAEVVATRRMPIPPWFNLAWMAFRTITAFEHEEGVPEDDAADPAGDAAP
jgi:copper chaperone CopZ